MNEPRSVLIIQTAFIGDVILATALIESLHQKFPQASIDFVVRKGNEPLLAGHPFLREVIVFDKRRKYANLIALIKKTRANKYDYVFNVQRFATTGIMTVLSGAKTTVGFDKNPMASFFSRKVHHQQEGLHEVQRNQKLIEFLVGKERSRPKLYPTQAQYEKVSQYKNSQYITISPASVWFTKQFPVEKWIEFISIIPNSMSIFLLGGAEDKTLTEKIIAGSRRKNITSLAGDLSLLESAALMKDAEMNYVNDSAPMHLASSQNAAVSAIYCSTVPAFGFGPLSDRAFVIETIEELDCKPCGLHGHRECPQGHFRCALTIQKEQLLATLTREEPVV